MLLQISDNPELFQPVQEEMIMAANSGEFINDQLWGQAVSTTLALTLHSSIEHQRRSCGPFFVLPQTSS